MATISTPVRQPFGILDESKLRSLQSIKNRQNALAPSSAPSLKRRAPSPEISDSENIDPGLFESSIKRKRASLEDDVSIAKQARYTTHVVSSTKTYTPTSTVSAHTATPRLESLTRPTSTTPLSAPAAAGRSPTRLRPHSRLDKYSSQPRRRFVPPSFRPSSPSVSIAAALKGTLAHKKRPSASRAKTYPQSNSIEETKPKSWFFDIFEESEETQDYRICEWTMTQSSAALDISDEEGKLKSFDGEEQADKGKENIDPNEMSTTIAPVTRAAAATLAAARAEEKKEDDVTEEPRTPLGDLNAADYYGEGLSATSVVLVHDDAPAEEEANDTETTTAPVVATENSTSSTAVPAEEVSEPPIPAEEIPEWAQRTSQITCPEDKQDSFDPTISIHQDNTEPTDIEIWESESAKDENENENGQEENHQSGAIIVGEGERISVSAFCLQEL